MTTWLKITYLDASAAFKLIYEEHRSDVVRAYCREEAPVWITQFCYFEMFGILKRMLAKREIQPNL